MNIISTPAHHPKYIHAEIDREARRVFAAFSKGLASLHRRMVPTREKSVLEDILFASQFCTRLGEHSSGCMDILIANACRTFAVTMKVCSIRRELIGPSYGLAVVLQLLACLTLVPIPPSPLPPAVELFGKGCADEEYFMAYEHVRLWRKPGCPQLQILLASHLWEMLRSRRSLPRCVQRFVGSLEGVTAAFRQTVTSLQQSALDDAHAWSGGDDQ